LVDGQLKKRQSALRRAEWRAHVSHPYSMPREHFDVYYCRELKGSLQQMWPMVKNWH
jgi:hypothetical protein